MITETYVSFETAKLLKEKEFNEMTELAYELEHGHIRSDLPVSYWRNSEIGKHKFSCPTQQMAMKWLRDIHNLFIQIFILTDNGYWFFIDKLLDNYNHRYLYSTGSLDIYYPTYEEACEAGIKYCLENLIV